MKHPPRRLPRRHRPAPAGAPGNAPVRRGQRRHHPRAQRLRGRRRAVRQQGRAPRRGVGRREQPRGHLSPRDHVLAHPRRPRQPGLRRGRRRRAAQRPLLGRRGAGAHLRAVAGRVGAAQGGAGGARAPRPGRVRGGAAGAGAALGPPPRRLRRGLAVRGGGAHHRRVPGRRLGDARAPAEPRRARRRALLRRGRPVR